MTNKVIGRIDLGAFGDYDDPDFYEIENGCAIIEYIFLVDAYEDILCNLGGDLQAEAFLYFVEENEHGTFIGDGYRIEF